MKKVGLVVKNDQKARAAAADLRTWLTSRGLEVLEDEPHTVVNDQDECPAPMETGGPDADMVVVLGGDGTLLYAARTMGLGGVPLLGVNMGGLGFLTEIALENLHMMVERVLAGDYRVEERMMLSVEVNRTGCQAVRHVVLNDAVINKGALARILRLRVDVDQFRLGEYRADGLIISTPTGSTAYNMAAGGPIVHPAHETIILTPICPFTLGNRPIILPEKSSIQVHPGAEDADVLLTLDGQVSCPLGPGDSVTVRRSENRINLVKNPYKNYFDILRTKLGWG